MFSIFSAAQAIMVVILEVISTAVLNVPIGMFNKPIGQVPGAALTRSRM